MIGIPASRKEWEHLDPNDLEAYARLIFAHYRERGYPVHSMSDEEKREDLLRLVAYREQANVIESGSGKSITTGTHALGLCWSYFPHAVSVRCNGRSSPLDIFNNDDSFLTAIRKRLKYGTYISDNGIRKALRRYGKTQAVSNFRPTAALAIYRRYRAGRLTVWDMSAGYGGRLVGAWASDTVARYIGTEPCVETFSGLRRLEDDVRRFGILQPMAVELHCIGSEDFSLPRESVDLCFTSPPYFDTEHYSDELSQSYKKFPTYQGWLTGFLRETLARCRYSLCHDGFLALNVANTKRAPSLVNDVKNIAEDVGFIHFETIALSLASLASGGYKYESVLVFARGNAGHLLAPPEEHQ